MAPLDTDRALLDAFRRGDRDALGAVYYEHVDAVAALVRRGFVIESQGHRFVPGARDLDAEHELTQEVFTRAFGERARLAYDGLRPYRPYLLRIAKNLLIDRLRLRGRDTVSVDEVPDGADEEDVAESGEQDHEDALHWKRLSEIAQAYLADLDEEARTFIRLRFEEERSQDEVASLMKTTRRRVRTLEDRVEVELMRRLKSLGISGR
jgi:RNA polymerase sigma-70 factor (ECF subfamily)